MIDLATQSTTSHTQRDAAASSSRIPVMLPHTTHTIQIKSSDMSQTVLPSLDCTPVDPRQTNRAVDGLISRHASPRQSRPPFLFYFIFLLLFYFFWIYSLAATWSSSVSFSSLVRGKPRSWEIFSQPCQTWLFSFGRGSSAH